MAAMTRVKTPRRNEATTTVRTRGLRRRAAHRAPVSDPTANTEETVP